ncbi:MAG: internalin [Verrucomicrobiota bacterium]|jgi:hypothetical protein
MKDPQNFVDWVCDPARTNDELFTVELLIEQRRHDRDWAFPEFREDFNTHMETMRTRGANPAYRPGLHEGEIEQLSVQGEKVVAFHGGTSPDRPLRDLRALAFFPALISVSANGDFNDLSPLASLPSLKSLSISEHMELAGSHRLRLEECGAMPELEHCLLSLHQAWPDLRRVETWPRLVQLTFSGNVLAWEGMRTLPVPGVIHLKAGPCANTPLRDLTKLPEMPAVKVLAIERTESLEGIERYPSALNVELAGSFSDLRPLAAMTNITALTLTGEFFRDLTPLAAMPKLRELRFVRERGIDLSPLADCPQLRRVEMERCAMMRTELAGLNAGLLPEAPDFYAEEPRKLKPLAFFRIGDGNDVAEQFFRNRQHHLVQGRTRFYDGDAALSTAEKRAMGNNLQRRFDELLGRGWGIAGRRFHAPGIINLKRFEDTTRVHEVIQVLREESARSRFSWYFLLCVEPHADMSDELEEIKARDEEAASPEGDWLAEYYEPDTVLRENEAEREQRSRRYEFMEREHLLQLRGDESLDPALLSLPKEEEEPIQTAEDEESFSPPTNDEKAGGIAIAPPPPLPPDTKNLGEKLAYYLDVFEDCIVANEHWADKAAYSLGQKPVEWTPELAGGENLSS